MSTFERLMITMGFTCLLLITGINYLEIKIMKLTIKNNTFCERRGLEFKTSSYDVKTKVVRTQCLEIDK